MFTVTPVLAAVEQPFTVAVTMYVPEAAAVTFEIVGFWSEDVNPFGPVQRVGRAGHGRRGQRERLPRAEGPLLPAVGTFGWP